jgi:hypothetical protein
MSAMGRMLTVAGLALAVLGVLLVLGDRVPLLGKLPGDIRIEGENGTFYFPIASCILLSVVLTVVVNVALRLFGRG